MQSNPKAEDVLNQRSGLDKSIKEHGLTLKQGLSVVFGWILILVVALSIAFAVLFFVHQDGINKGSNFSKLVERLSEQKKYDLAQLVDQLSRGCQDEMGMTEMCSSHLEKFELKEEFIKQREKEKLAYGN